MQKFKNQQKVSVYHNGNFYEGTVWNYNDFRPPKMEYAVILDDKNVGEEGVIFVSEEQLSAAIVIVNPHGVKHYKRKQPEYIQAIQFRDGRDEGRVHEFIKDIATLLIHQRLPEDEVFNYINDYYIEQNNHDGTLCERLRLNPSDYVYRHSDDFKDDKIHVVSEEHFKRMFEII